MSEEVDDAARNVPRAIFTTVVLNGALGFGMLVATLSCLGVTQTVLDTPTGYPFIQILFDAPNSHVAAYVWRAHPQRAVVHGYGQEAVPRAFGRRRQRNRRDIESIHAILSSSCPELPAIPRKRP